MVEATSKHKDELFCPNCHSKLPKGLSQKDEKGEFVIFCPYCGTQITLMNDEDDNKADKTTLELSTETKEPKDVKLSLTNKEIRHIIRIFIYRNIYQMIKQNKSIMRRLISQKDLSKAHISYLTSKIRNTLLNTSNPVQGASQELTNPAIRKLDTFYKKFTSSLKDKKVSRERNSLLLTENIQFIYNLIRGDYTFEDLSETKRTIVLDLKEFFGIKEESESKKTLNYNISLFLALKIHPIIKKNKSTNLNKSIIDEIINTITELVLYDDFFTELFKTLEIYQKRSVTNFLKEFEFNITYDWVYRASFQDHVFKLIYLVNKLFWDKDYWSNLTGSNKLIAEGLQENSLFQNDSEFSAYFRLNLTIILCRIIHKIMQDSPDIPQALSNHPHLNPSLKQELLEYLLKEITAQKNINFEFLEKFYKLSLEEFQANYKKFQTKLTPDMIYHHNFRTYLSKLIKMVYAITHSVCKKSQLSKVERVIINDLANYNFRWNPERGTKYYFYSNEKEPEITRNEIEASEFQNIFNKEIADDDPLWRVRAYVMGFLLADGYIQKRKNKDKRKYRVIVKQHKRDMDLLKIAQKSLGGEIKPQKKNIYYIEISNKELVLTLLEYGMVEGHSKEKNAIILSPPKFILHNINGQSLIRDFIRGFYDGDGWFTGSCKESSASFQINGPYNFLNRLKEMISIEIPNLTCSINDERVNIFKYKDKEYRLYSKFRIYIPKKGFYKLKSNEINEGIIERRSHPWLKVLSISGTFNVIRFFNWFYEDNDYFYDFNIKGIKICGKRKFSKALHAIGDILYRKEKISPSLIDVMPEVFSNLEPRLYDLKELSKLLHRRLREILKEMDLTHLFTEKKSKSVGNLRERLKLHEYRDEIIASYQRRVGRSNINYYYNPYNPPSNIPSDYKKKIYLINRNGKIRRSIKNYIIKFFLENNNVLINFEELKNILIKTPFCIKKNIRPYRLTIGFMELKYFNFIISDNSKIDFSKQSFILNLRKLCEYFIDTTDSIKRKLKDTFE